MFSRFLAKALGDRFTTAATGLRQYTGMPSNPIVRENISKGSLLGVLAGVIGGTFAIYYATNKVVEASFGVAENKLEAPHYPWVHKSMFKSLDHAAIRRGFHVYKEIGSVCHSMKFLYYRQLINVAYTDEEIKAIAAEHDDFLTEPDDEGEIHEREGLPGDKFWKPYKNDKEARANNNGSLPPDLTLIVRARPQNEDYIFALLTGYRDPPHGVKMGENMYHNVYFPGCQIAMPPPLAAGAVEFDDGTEASLSQMAKDVTVYLTWSAFMEHDERHLMGLKTLSLLALAIPPFLYWKKWKWSYVKHRSVAFNRDWAKPVKPSATATDNPSLTGIEKPPKSSGKSEGSSH